MKIHYIDDEELEGIRRQMKNYGKPKKPKSPKLDNKLIAKVGKVLYNFDQAKEVLIRVRLKDGTSIAYRRDEDEDRFENMKRRADKQMEEDDE